MAGSFTYASAGVEVTSIADMVSQESGTEVNVACPLTVAFVNNKNVFVQDEAGDAIQIYNENTLKVGDVIPGNGWGATYTLFNNVTPELEKATLPTDITAGEFTPETLTSGEITNADVNRVVILKDVTFAAATPSAKENFDGTWAGNTYSFRNNYTIAGVEAGTYDVRIVITVYNNTPSLYVVEYVGANPQPPTPPEPGENGSAEAPLTVNEFLAKGIPEAAVADTYVTGYVVGFVNGSDMNATYFGIPSSVEADKLNDNAGKNIVIAADINESDISKCIPVQLPTGDVRNALNLIEHPENYGATVVLGGSREKYYKVAGLKSVKYYKITLNGDTPNPPTPPTPVVKEINSVKEAIASEDGTKVKVNFPLTVAFVPKGTDGTNWKNIFCVDDAGDAIQVYGENSYNDNDVIPSGWEASYKLFKGTPELEPTAALPAADGTKTYVPAEITDGVITNADVNRVLLIKNVTFTAATPSEKENFEGTSNGQTLSFRNNYTIAGVEAGEYDVKVVVTLYNDAPSLYVISYDNPNSIESIDVENAPAVYYDLNGRQVSGDLEQGIYVRLQGGKATKVIVK